MSAPPGDVGRAAPATLTPRPPPRGLMALAIGVAAAAIGILLVLGLVILPMSQSVPAVVVLSVGTSVGQGGSATVKVDSASAAYRPSFYRVNMAIGATNGSSLPMPATSNASVYIIAENHTFGVRWTDWDGGGRVTAGDTFSVTPLGGPILPPGQELRFWLLQTSNASVASVGWIVPGPKPVVILGALYVSASWVTFQVVATTAVVPVSLYRFDLYSNGTHAASSVRLNVGTNYIGVGGTTYWVNYTDVSGNGNLKSGDVIKVQPQPAGSTFASGSYTFYLIWAADGSTVQTTGWTLSRPVVTFGTLSVLNGSVSFLIAGAYPSFPLSNYRFNLALNGTLSASPVALGAGVNQITSGGTTFWVNYTDISGNGYLKSGDFIRVQAQPAGSLLPSGSYQFILIWAADSSVVGSQSWTI